MNQKLYETIERDIDSKLACKCKIGCNSSKGVLGQIEFTLFLLHNQG